MPCSPKLAHSYLLETSEGIGIYQCEARLWVGVTVVHFGLVQLTFLTLSVFEAETSFVALCHLGAVGSQDIIVSENVHTVVMPMGTREPVSFPDPSRFNPSPMALPFYSTLSPMTLVPHPGVAPSLGPEVSSSQVVNLGGESE